MLLRSAMRKALRAAALARERDRPLSAASALARRSSRRELGELGALGGQQQRDPGAFAEVGLVAVPAELPRDHDRHALEVLGGRR